MKATFLALSIFAVTLGAASADTETCTNHMESRGNITIRRLYYPDDGACHLSVSSTDIKDIYRDYSFDNNGGMMVFNSYGEFDGELRFGTREFFFLPKKNSFPQFNWNDEKAILEVTLTSGQIATFKYEDAELQSISGAEVQVSKDLHPRSLGGVEVKNQSGILLDTGYQLDRLSSQYRERLSVFSDSQSNTCKVANKNIFKYKSNGDLSFGLSNEKLNELLTKKCPNLSL